MKSLNNIINEKLVINKNSKVKKHSTLEEFLNKYGFKYIPEDSHEHHKFYKPTSKKIFNKYYNNLKKLIGDIYARPQVYEEDIDLDTDKYCIKCNIESTSLRIKFCDKVYVDYSSPVSLSSIIMFNDGDKELLYRRKKNLDDKTIKYLEEKLVDLFENIFNI